MRKVTKILTPKNTLFFGLALISANAFGKDRANLDAILNLSLEELLNLSVSVASFEPESITDTPEIVSRYERSDLESMGITSLRGMFNFVPGVIVQRDLPGNSSVQIRGIDESFNQKVLFLLDGIPYHQPSHSLIPMEGIPWEAISHIEVIRGPGAVIHGTQASGGVFNVVTRKDTQQNSVYIKAGGKQLFTNHWLLWRATRQRCFMASFRRHSAAG